MVARWFRTKAQADALVASGLTPDAFVLLDVIDEILVERVVGRRTDPETGIIYHVKFKPLQVMKLQVG